MTDSPEGRRIAGNSRGRYVNEGIRLSAIALWLETAEAESPQGREDVVRLRTLFGGLNQRVGFFGALGRRGYGRSASEVVADSCQHRPEMLDLGYWDTRTIVNYMGGIWDILPDICRVVFEMGLDVWCFSALDANAVETVCQQLWAIYGLNYQPVASLQTARGTGPRMLVRPSNLITAESCEVGNEKSYVAIRLRVRKRDDSEAEFRLATYAQSVKDLDNPAEIARQLVANLEESQPQVCGLVVGEPEMLEIFRDILVGRDPNHSFAATNSRDGSLVILDYSQQNFSHTFLSANLKPAFDLSRQFTIVHDRNLPNDLTVWAGPSPFAVRISLDSGESLAKTPHTRLLPPSLTPGADSSIEALEIKLREVLIPLMTKIITETVRGKP